MTTDALIPQLEAEEGFRAEPYQDAGGVWTQGFGNTHEVTSDSPPVTDAEAEQTLICEVTRVCAELDHALPWWRSLCDVRQDVLADMAFNMGVTGLLGFQNMLTKVHAGNWAAASGAMLMSEWAGEVGERAVKLAAMMRTGERP